MKNRITSTFAALVMVVAALVTAGTMTAGAAETGECTTETTGWLTSPPAGTGWVQIDSKTVTDEEAYTEVVTPSQWWNWSPNNTQGPQDYTPNFPSDPDRGTWQGPHTNGGPAGEGTFNVSNGSSGNSSWFHRSPAEVIEHPAETHEEYRYEREVCEPDGPTPVQFSTFGTTTPPTCDSPGSFQQASVPGVRITVTPTYDGPGTYVVTATLEDPVNTTFPNGSTDPRSITVTVDDATGVTQSTNPNAPCYQATPPGEEEPPGENPPGGNTPGGNVPTGSSTGAGPTAPSGSMPTGSTPSGGVPTSIDAGL